MCALEDAYSKSSATPQVEHLKGRPMPSTEHGEDLEHHIHGGGGLFQVVSLYLVQWFSISLRL